MTIPIGLTGLTVYTLRHTAAKLGASRVASLEDVQAVLGHATTARYLARLEGTGDRGWQAARRCSRVSTLMDK